MKFLTWFPVADFRLPINYFEQDNHTIRRHRNFAELVDADGSYFYRKQPSRRKTRSSLHLNIGRCVQAEAERAHDLEHRGELRVAVR